MQSLLDFDGQELSSSSSKRNQQLIDQLLSTSSSFETSSQHGLDDVLMIGYITQWKYLLFLIDMFQKFTRRWQHSNTK